MNKNLSNLELNLLQMWKENGIENIYKYNNIIRWHRNNDRLENIDLFCDVSQQMFNHCPDFAQTCNPVIMSVNSLIKINSVFKDEFNIRF